MNKEDNTMILSCIVDSPKAALRWYKNGKKLTRCKHYEMIVCKTSGKKYGLLRLDSATYIDNGIYTCTATDSDHNRVSTSCPIYMAGKFMKRIIIYGRRITE